MLLCFAFEGATSVSQRRPLRGPAAPRRTARARRNLHSQPRRCMRPRANLAPVIDARRASPPPVHPAKAAEEAPTGLVASASEFWNPSGLTEKHNTFHRADAVRAVAD